MKIIVMILMLFTTAAWAAGRECDHLPSGGAVQYNVRLADGTMASFRAVLEIETVPVYGRPDQRQTSHTFRKPQFVVNGKSVVMTSRASQVLAKLLGYESQSLEVLIQNKWLFGEKEVIDVKNGAFILRSAESGESYQDREAYVMFYHSRCADWTY